MGGFLFFEALVAVFNGRVRNGYGWGNLLPVISFLKARLIVVRPCAQRREDRVVRFFNSVFMLCAESVVPRYVRTYTVQSVDADL